VEDLTDYERRFRSAGLPLLIEDYSASKDVFTRAVPLLTLVFLGQVLGALDFKWGFLANVGAVAGAIAIVFVVFGAINRSRGRPFFSRPREVGGLELAAFVLIPASLPLIFGQQTTSAVVTLAGNLTLLALVWLVIGFGLPSIVCWAGARLVQQLTASLALLARALPLLFIFAVVLLLTTEMWQTFSALSYGLLGLVGGLFVVVGGLFVGARLPREVERLEEDAGGDGPPLSTAQRVNVGLVLGISQALQVLVVALAVGAFFIALGALAITPDVQKTWIGHAPHKVVSLSLLGGRPLVSEELLRVAGAIAAFSGLYYAIAVLTDSTYREEFLEELTAEMRETFRARSEYLRLRGTA